MRYTKIIKASVAAAVLMALISPRVSFAANISGEIGAKYSLYKDQTDKMYRLQQYLAQPRRGSFTDVDLNLDKIWFVNDIAFTSKDLGEDDVSAALKMRAGSLARFEAGYDKTPHQIDLTSGYSTMREKSSYKLHLFDLGPVSITAAASFEDKTGAISSNLVGQQVKKQSAEASTKLGPVVLDGGVNHETLVSNLASHTEDGYNGAGTLSLMENKIFLGGSYARLNYKPDAQQQTSSNTNTPLNETLSTLSDGSVAVDLFKNLSLGGYIAKDKNQDASANNLSADDSSYLASADYRWRSSRLGVSYKKVDRSYTNAEIASSKTDSYTIKGSTNFSIINFKADYQKGKKDIAGAVTDAAMYNFDQFANNFINSGMSVTLLGFQKVGLTVFDKKTSKNYSPTATYGDTGFDSQIQGFSSYYLASPNTTLTLGYTVNENRLSTHQKFWATVPTSPTDPTPINANMDLAYQTYTDSECWALGASIQANPSTTVNLNLTKTTSNLLDPNQNLVPLFNNQTKENIFGLDITKILGKNLSVDLGYTYNTYKEYGDAAEYIVQPSNSQYTVEFKTKF